MKNFKRSLSAHWLPAARGDDYEITAQARAGKSFGQVPFDELFTLGMERDNDLWLRAHIGTHDGKKGSAPIGRDYFLTNWQLDKVLNRTSLLRISMGPFVDTGKILDSSPLFGSTTVSSKFLCDVGVQAKVRVLGAFGWCSLMARTLALGATPSMRALRNSVLFDAPVRAFPR